MITATKGEIIVFNADSSKVLKHLLLSSKMSSTLPLDKAISSVFVDNFGLSKEDGSAEDVRVTNCCFGREELTYVEAIHLMGIEVGST